MPLTRKGKKIKRAMQKTYGMRKGMQVFYASERKGTIQGIVKETGHGKTHSDRKKSHPVKNKKR